MSSSRDQRSIGKGEVQQEKSQREVKAEAANDHKWCILYGLTATILLTIVAYMIATGSLRMEGAALGVLGFGLAGCAGTRGALAAGARQGKTARRRSS